MLWSNEFFKNLKKCFVFFLLLSYIFCRARPPRGTHFQKWPHATSGSSCSSARRRMFPQTATSHHPSRISQRRSLALWAAAAAAHATARAYRSATKLSRNKCQPGLKGPFSGGFLGPRRIAPDPKKRLRDGFRKNYRGPYAIVYDRWTCYSRTRPLL